MSKATLQKIIALLQDNNISFEHIEHETIPPNSPGAAKVRGTNLHDGVKALVLKTKENVFFQVLIPAHKRANLKSVKQAVSAKNVSLASPDEVLALTDCIVGSVPPFGVLWNIQVFADNSLEQNSIAVFSAGTLEDSMKINPGDLLKINEATIADFAKEME